MTSEESASLTRQLRLLGNQLMTLASKASLNHAAPADRPIFEQLRQDSDLWLLAAKDMYDERLSRRRFFSPELFREPGWDILLDLYIAEKESQPVSVTAACAGAQVPMTTALRYLKVLEEEGLILREPDPRDGRRHHVRISEKGYAQMTAFIADQRSDWVADDPLPSSGSRLPARQPVEAELIRRAG